MVELEPQWVVLVTGFRQKLVVLSVVLPVVVLVALAVHVFLRKTLQGW